MCEQKDPFAEFFRMRKPCANCPFRKVGAIHLMPGRLDGIIEDLLANDKATFTCHKTLAPSDDDEEIDEDGNLPLRSLRVDDGEKMCAGAATYLMKERRPSVGMRIAFATGSIPIDQWDDAESLIIEPINKVEQN